MALANDGEISLGGDTAERSIALELQLSSNASISMNDESIRTLAGKTIADSEVNLSSDFYGKSFVPLGATARYFRFTQWIPYASGSFVTRLQIYSGANGTGTSLGTLSNISANFTGTGDDPTNAYYYTNVLNEGIGQGWWQLGQSESQQYENYIQFDLGSPTLVKSLLVENRSGGSYGAQSLTVQYSNDEMNWYDLEYIYLDQSELRISNIPETSVPVVVPSQYLPATLEGYDSATDYFIPIDADFAGIGGSEAIIGTAFWRRVRLTASTAGVYRFYCNPYREFSAGVSYRSDMQSIMTIVTQAGVESEYPMLTGGVSATGWERSAKTNTTSSPTSWEAVNGTGTAGLFVFRNSPGRTPSGGTGRLVNFIDVTQGYGFFESSSIGNTVPVYFWLRSPQYTLSAGDTIDFYYGVDCTGLDSITFSLEYTGPVPVILDVVTVTQGIALFASAAYYGFRGAVNPDVGSVSPTNLTISGTSYDIREIYRRPSRTSGVDDDSTSSFYFTVYEAGIDGSVPADNWFSSVLVQTSGDPVTLTPATATIFVTAGRKEWRWFSGDFTSAEITALSAKWNGSNTSTLTFME